MNQKFKKLIYLVLIGIIVTSCVPQKKILYLQSQVEGDTTNVFPVDREQDYKVQPGDNLYVRIFSLEEKAAEFFNKEGSRSQGNYYNEAGIYLNSYSISDSGNIDFPLVGKIHVKDFTTEEVKKKIQEIINEYLTGTTIIVKLVNFNITLLGEFKRPGKYQVYQDHINIFEAVSMGGDLTDYANRGNVALIRQTEKGSVLHRLDLNDLFILESDFYLLQPNDIVYVQPLKGKQFTFAQFPYGLVFGAISTTLLLINYFK